MAQDFYRRAQVLHEEFQRRELEYLNAEKKWNNTIWNKDHSLPLQDYMQKIDKREKETEEAYRNVLKQMDELDRQANLMSLKLNKLGTLGNNMATFAAPTWPYNVSHPSPLTFNPTSSFHNNANLSLLSQKLSLRSVSTQTENKILCQNCNSQLSLCDKTYPPIGAEHLHATASGLQQSAHNFQHLIPDSSQGLFSQNPRSSFTSLYEDKKISESIMSPVFNDKPLTVPSTGRSFMIESETDGYVTGIFQQNAGSRDLSEQITVTDNAPLHRPSTSNYERMKSESSVSSAAQFSLQKENLSVLLEEQAVPADYNVSQNEIQEAKIVTPESVITEQENAHVLNQKVAAGDLLNKQSTMQRDDIKQNNAEDAKVISNTNAVSQVPVKEVAFAASNAKLKSTSTDSKDPSTAVEVEDNVDVSVSKSDEESMKSMNREFDFLESDSANVSIDTRSQVKEKSSLKNLDANPAGLKSKEQLSVMSEKHALDTIGDKSDISSSVTGPASPSIHSANISIASDSDSVGDKETPLKASAAYQALLGNTAVLEKSKKKYLDSDSEDEVESALANAVRRSSHALPQQKKDGKALSKKSEQPTEEVDSKPAMKSSKPSVISKPQSKLSKSTRKVLGLETSSGSEVELVAKPPGKKDEEESDEFDFFD